MNIMKTLILNGLVALAAVGTISAHAGDLKEDEGKIAAPRGVLVRFEEKTQQATVYQLNAVDSAAFRNKDTAEAFLQKNAVAANVVKVQTIDAGKKPSELDEKASDSAWNYFYYGNYWSAANYFTWAPSWNWGANYNWGYYPYNYNYNYSYAYAYAYPYQASYGWGGARWYAYW